MYIEINNEQAEALRVMLTTLFAELTPGDDYLTWTGDARISLNNDDYTMIQSIRNQLARPTSSEATARLIVKDWAAIDPMASIIDTIIADRQLQAELEKKQQRGR